MKVFNNFTELAAANGTRVPSFVSSNSIDTSEYAEFKIAEDRRPVARGFSYDYSEKTLALKDRVEEIKKEYSDQLKTLKKIFQASRPGEKNQAEPENITKYTGVQPTDPNWSEAKQKYISDLRNITYQKYYDEARKKYNELVDVEVEMHESMDADRIAEGCNPIRFGRQQVEGQIHSPSSAERKWSKQ